MARPRPLLVAGNWKMNHGRKAAQDFSAALVPAWKSAFPSGLPATVRAELYAPLLSIETLRAALSGTGVEVGAQNVHWEEKGAFTAETSAAMLKEIGVDRALVGHSERRQYFGETDATVKARAERALTSGMQVILCIGETRAEREAGETEKVLERQLANGLPSAWNDRLVLAYEPVWAIGTGLTATPEQAEAAHAFTRGSLARRYHDSVAKKALILYGGSVTPENARAIFAQPNVDGGLVGGASLKPESFLSLVQAAATCS